MKKFSPKEIILPAAALLIIGLICSGILAFVNNVTAPIISKISYESEVESRKVVLPNAKTFGDAVEKDGVSYVEGKGADGETAGYVFTTSSKGYGGTISVMTGIDADGRITGLQILSIDETPGLGMNAKKDSWLSQFTGKFGTLTVVKGDSASDEQIQAITSATITSKAVTDAVNQATQFYSENLSKEAA